MKKLTGCLILVLSALFLMPTTAFGASSYSVDVLNVTAELRSDGSVLMTEEWEVTFSGEADGFVREIVIPEDNIETFASVSDVSVSVDGNGCNADADGTASDGTYTFVSKEDRYVITWNKQTENGTHVFSLRYVLNSAVKLYDGQAYFYCTAVNDDSGLVCRNVSVEVKAPGESFAEEYTIVESGSLAGKKVDGAVIFTAYNTAGEVKTGVTFPPSLFDTQKLPVVTVDSTATIVVGCVAGAVFVAVCIYIIYHALHYRQLFRKKWEKKCRKTALDESSYKVRTGILRKMSSAEILNLVTEETVSGADKFIVHFLELVSRGYITVTADGFSVSKKSESDSTGRPLDAGDKLVMDFFGSDKWHKTVEDPEKFFHFVEAYNKKLGFVNPLTALTADGRRHIMRCFELSLSAKRHEFVVPEEISDDFIKGGKYTVIDLIVSVLNEYSLSCRKDFVKPDTSKYKRNMFMLRDIYENGREIAERKELERLRQKKRKKRKTVAEDDFDSQ